MKASLHFNLEILTENNDQGEQRKNREAEQNEDWPIPLTVIEVQRDQRGDNGNKNENEQGEHIVLLRFQVGKKEDDAICKSCKANNGNDKNSKAIIDKQEIYNRNQNTAPSRNLNRLAQTVELYKIGGEDHFPNDPKGKNNENTPKRSTNARIDDRCRYGNPQKGPTHNVEHSFAVVRYLGDLGIGVFNVHNIHSLPLLL